MNPFAAFALRVEEFGPWAPLLFIVVYVAASVAFIPAALLTLAGGAVFGLARGIPIVFTAALLGSSASFGVARTVARDRVTRWLARDPRAAAVNDAIAAEGVKVVLLLRLSPLFPYNVLNYALGLSRVRYRDFVLGSLGMLPGTVLYTYYGTIVGDVAALAAGTAPVRGVEYYVLLGVGLLATATVMLVITRAARRALGRQRERGTDS